MAQPCTVITEENAELLAHALAHIFGADADAPQFCVALDIEGVDLGRTGSMEIVSINVPVDADGERQTFLLDVQNADAAAPHVQLLQELATHPNCKTVIHDCRQDCDAMRHLWGFVPADIHDTSEAHRILTGQENKNLNDTLTANGLATNVHRMRVNYQANPSFWAQRPLTQNMLEHAAGDVHLLPRLFALQAEAAPHENAYTEASRRYAGALADLECEWLPCRKSMGAFIGPKGRNVRATEKRTGCYFYGNGSERERKTGFLVYYPRGRRHVAVQALS